MPEPVLPLKPGDKTPITAHGLKDATTNENRITQWWDRWPDANIGIATGEEAGFWVLDIDGEEGSVSLLSLQKETAPIPETLEQKTGGGGRQLFFRWPAKKEIRNKQNFRPHIDVRGNGGYVVVPPSLHPSGQRYDWPYGIDTEIADAPAALLDVLAPKKRNVPPWERIDPPGSGAPPAKSEEPSLSGSVSVVERARLYLQECDPAVQGSGGHNALLWAARAMVVGFELDDATALNLLWAEFNPRCSPPWDRSDSRERRDFERKVKEARDTSGEKPRGWLLDEYGLRSSTNAMAILPSIRESVKKMVEAATSTDSNPPDAPGREPFPLECFPQKVADFCRQVADAHVVDRSFAGLPALVVAGAAMGNAWRLQCKKGFVVPPILWAGLASPSGTNKSGPLNEVMSPLRAPVPIDEAADDTILNPQGRVLLSDATLEALIARMAENPRGVCCFRDELAGWAKSFNAYKKGGGGGDEQAWIEFWGAKEYILDRKTNDEQLRIPAAACSVIGGIQPKIFAECFDPGKFASGLVPRILIACPPVMDMYWTEDVVADDASDDWHDAIMWLRTRPFKALNTNTGRFEPHVLKFSPDAKKVYVEYFNAVSHLTHGMEDEHCRSVASKARVMAARMALIHHGLVLACGDGSEVAGPVGVDSAKAGVAWAKWCLAEQMRVFQFSNVEYARKQADYLLGCIKDRCKGNSATVRQVQRLNAKRYKNADAAVAAMEQLVEAGYARWADERKQKIILV
jgi:hypothetical protein